MAGKDDRKPSSELSVSDLVRSLQTEKGLTRAEIARELGRSPRMVGKLLNGESKGESFRESLASLRDKGTVSRRPPRRRNRAGELVAVRAKADPDAAPATAEGKTKAPTRIPEDTAGTWTSKVPSRFSSKTSYADNGDRIYSVTMHKANKKSRERGINTIADNLRTITRSQAKSDKRITFTATLDNGRVVTVGSKGGYFSSDVLRKINSEFGGNANNFIMDQLAKVYPGDSTAGKGIAGLQMSVYDAKGTARNSRKRR